MLGGGGCGRASQRFFGSGFVFYSVRVRVVQLSSTAFPFNPFSHHRHLHRSISSSPSTCFSIHSKCPGEEFPILSDCFRCRFLIIIIQFPLLYSTCYCLSIIISCFWSRIWFASLLPKPTRRGSWRIVPTGRFLLSSYIYITHVSNYLMFQNRKPIMLLSVLFDGILFTCFSWCCSLTWLGKFIVFSFSSFFPLTLNYILVIF